jgi:hypothetical protein
MIWLQCGLDLQKPFTNIYLSAVSIEVGVIES